MLVTKLYQESRDDEDDAEFKLKWAKDRLQRRKKKAKEAKMALEKAKKNVEAIDKVLDARKKWRKKVQERLVRVTANVVEHESESSYCRPEDYMNEGTN